MAARRQIVLDEPMKSSQPVAGNGGVHVMFNMIVHVPVKKLDDRISGEGAAAEPKIGYLVLQADVLRIAAKKQEPAAIKGREADEDR